MTVFQRIQQPGGFLHVLDQSCPARAAGSIMDLWSTAQVMEIEVSISERF